MDALPGSRLSRCRSPSFMGARWISSVLSVGRRSCMAGRTDSGGYSVRRRQDGTPLRCQCCDTVLQGVCGSDERAPDIPYGVFGKVSPVHLFWGSFDIAVTRFSGRHAPSPRWYSGLPDEITREAYSHEVSSAGFWPGGGAIDFPAFYSYAYPMPTGFAAARISPQAAYYDENLGEFLLPYDAVRLANNPEDMLMTFLESTYRAAAELGDWDRAALECKVGKPRQPRPM